MPLEPAAAVEVSRLAARLRAEERKLALVQEIGTALSTGLDLDQLLALIMDKITLLMEADRSTLYLTSADGKELWSKVTKGGEIVEIRLRLGEGVAGWVAASGETVNVADVYSDRRFQPAFDLRTGYRTRSVLCMPMRNGLSATVGVIQVLNKRDGTFTEEDELLLEALASQAAIAIDNAKLYHSVVAKNVQLMEAQAKLEQKSAELNILYEIEQEMNAALTLDELLDRLLRRAMALVGAQAGSILLRDRGTDELYFRSATGEASESVKRLRVPAGEGIAGWVAAQRTPVIVSDPSRDSRHRSDIAEKIGYRPRNILCAPLPAESDVLGAMELLDKGTPTSPSGFVEDDLKLIVLIAGQASKVIQLARAKEERLNQSRLATIGQMISGVLHDLKTPMTVVSGYAQLMARVEDPGERQAYADQIARQFKEMSAMTREVLAFARGESNLLIRKVYINRFVEDLTRHLEHEFSGKGIELIVDAAYRNVAYLDEQKMLRVVHNIGRNAAQAMPHGGSFRISTVAEGNRLVFEFVDTGPGIPTDMEGRLFELFATSGKKDGTGLGLAIVKKIVDEHRGDITCVSKPGQGTTFRMWIPLDPRADISSRGPGC